MNLATPTLRSVTLSTGVTLQYVEQGDRTRVPVVLLHGFTDSWHSFAPVLPHLPASVHAVALTQRGHGDADRPATGYRTRDFAADVAAFLQALDLGPAIVVGHSMGSTNALRFALDYPQLTRGLMLVGAFAAYGNNAAVTAFWNTGVANLSDPIDPAFVRDFQQGTLAQPVPPHVVDIAVRESLKVPARVWREVLAECLADDFARELEKIAAPTVVLWGDNDALIPRAEQETLVQAITGAHLVVYHGAGHAPHWEYPQRFAAQLSAFVADVEDRADPPVAAVRAQAPGRTAVPARQAGR